MKKFMAMIGSTKPDLNGDVFSEEALKKLAESPLPIPLTLEFQRNLKIGDVTGLYVENRRLIAVGLCTDFDDMVPVIGYQYDVHDEGKLKLFEVSLVPPDRALMPDTWIKEADEKLTGAGKIEEE